MYFRVIETENNAVKSDRAIPLKPGTEITIGRGQSCTVQIGAWLPKVVWDYVSRVQATLRVREDGACIIDGSAAEKSKSRIFVDGSPLKDGECRELTLDNKVMLFSTPSVRIEGCLTETSGKETVIQSSDGKETYPGAVGEALTTLWAKIDEVEPLIRDLEEHRIKAQEFDRQSELQMAAVSKQMQLVRKQMKDLRRWIRLLATVLGVIGASYGIQALLILSSPQQQSKVGEAVGDLVSMLVLAGLSGAIAFVQNKYSVSAPRREEVEPELGELEPVTRSLPPEG